MRLEWWWGGAERKGGNRVPETDTERLSQYRLREHDQGKQRLKENAGEKGETVWHVEPNLGYYT